MLESARGLSSDVHANDCEAYCRELLLSVYGVMECSKVCGASFVEQRRRCIASADSAGHPRLEQCATAVYAKLIYEDNNVTVNMEMNAVACEERESHALAIDLG